MQTQKLKVNEKLKSREEEMLKKSEAPPKVEVFETRPSFETAPPREKEGFLDETIENLKNALRRKKIKPTQIPQVRDAVTRQVEQIMAAGLEDAYREMTPLQRQEFKIEGEKTAWEIRNLLRAGRAKIKKIFQLILRWLRLLPGVNKFFLEQEAKIKADKIMAMNRSQRSNQ